jgi:glutamyl-Q tRNA(Asp) synthetase
LQRCPSQRRSAASGARSSTATATTATAELTPRRAAYCGRFAPTPSGPLHLGSLVAALASFLEARRQAGRWLLRIDDLDRPRVIDGGDTLIFRQLCALGLQWDGPVIYESRRIHSYEQTLVELRQRGLCFACQCSRRELRASALAAAAGDDVEPVCIGGCRTRAVPGPAALRVHLADYVSKGFADDWQGWIESNTAALTDRIVRRRDGVHAYHLAVVVDDLAAGVTDVVRGADLLSSTPAQIALYRALGRTPPRYAHAPIVLESDGSKLAKSRHSVAVGSSDGARRDLILALQLLRQDTPRDLDQVQVSAILEHAIAHWQPARFRGCRSVTAPAF